MISQLQVKAMRKDHPSYTSVWYQIEHEEIQELPYDTDRKYVYILLFDSRYCMMSMKESWPWKSWTT